MTQARPPFKANVLPKCCQDLRIMPPSCRNTSQTVTAWLQNNQPQVSTPADLPSRWSSYSPPFILLQRICLPIDPPTLPLKTLISIGTTNKKQQTQRRVTTQTPKFEKPSKTEPLTRTRDSNPKVPLQTKPHRRACARERHPQSSFV